MDQRPKKRGQRNDSEGGGQDGNTQLPRKRRAQQ